jgi:NitT/TauT family transport system permease protein
MKSRAVKNVIYTVAGAALFVAVWCVASAVYGKETIFPSPAVALERLAQELASAYFWRGFALTLLRSVMGFLCACVLALLCAFAGKAFSPLRNVLAPVVGILRSLPTMSVILFLVIWTSGFLTPVIISGLVIFPVLYSGIDAALCSVPRELEETARLYAKSSVYKFFRIYLPMSAPPFLKVAGGAASLSLKLTVAAEVLAQTADSIGFMMQQTRIVFDIGKLMALTVAVVVAALALEFAVYLVRRLFEYD